MELRDTETFLVLADELHFAKTAERLYLTPSRVTQTIQGLERKWAHHSSSLTAPGERFREATQLGFDQLHTALRDAQAAARGVEQVLRLGSQYSIGPEIALELARRPSFTRNVVHQIL